MVTDPRDRYGQTPLMRAAHEGRVDDVARLIASGADLDHHAKYGLTALMLAVVAGHDEIAALLHGAGADLAVRGTGAPGFDGKTALDLARDRGDAELVALLSSPPPHWAQPTDWEAAGRWFGATPARPRDTLGRTVQAFRVRLRDHRDRLLPAAGRDLEVHFDDFDFTQVSVGHEEARRRALEWSYGPEAMELRIGPHAGRGYERQPDPPEADPDPPLPTVVTWWVGERHFLLASATLAVAQLIEVAHSVE
ncbi:MAG: ankyrin repeat domain-containing protein [Gemmatimonadetes bacterium]|nr:ankyrin repeat domain-containing protein [Gemmatimonadota bacterium]